MTDAERDYMDLLRQHLEQPAQMLTESDERTVMNITLDEEKLRAATEAACEKAIADSLGGFTMQDRLRKAVSDAIETATIETAVQSAVEQTDWRQISAALAAEMGRVVQSMTIRMMREAAASTIVSLRVGSSYVTQEERAKAVAAVLAEMKADRAGLSINIISAERPE